MPTSRNVNSLLELTPGISSQLPASHLRARSAPPASASAASASSVIPASAGFNVGDTGHRPRSEQSRAGSSPRRRPGDQLRWNGTHRRADRRVHGRHRQLAGSQHPGVGRARRVGDRRLRDQHRAAHRRQPVSPATSTRPTRRRNGSTTNNGNYPNIPAAFQPVKNDHDVSLAFGGPIKRDRLWFYSVARDQGIHKLPVGVDFWPNLWEGKFGYNYQPDRNKPRWNTPTSGATSTRASRGRRRRRTSSTSSGTNRTSARTPAPASCPVYTSPESWFSPTTQAEPPPAGDVDEPADGQDPARSRRQRDHAATTPRTSHREFTNSDRHSARRETGDTAGADSTAPRVNQFAGGPVFALTSGSINNEIGGLSERRNLANYRSRASMSYVTGSHHAKFGYDGGYYSQLQTNKVNSMQETYNYVCAGGDDQLRGPGACGNTSLQFPSDPNNLARRPIPNDRGLQHRLRDAGRSRDVHGALRAGSVDVEAPHGQLRASLRSRDERLRGDLRRPEPVRAERLLRAGRPTASTTTT